MVEINYSLTIPALAVAMVGYMVMKKRAKAARALDPARQEDAPRKKPIEPSDSAPILAGVRILELATVVAAPSAARIMSDLGAEVIKIESPQGDECRNILRPLERGRKHVSNWDVWNAGKLSVQADITTPEGLAIVKKLLEGADVFLTNVRVESLQPRGLDEASIAKAFPNVVYCHLSAWGANGPWSQKPGYDSGAFWAVTGLSSSTQRVHALSLYPAGFGDLMSGGLTVAGIALSLRNKVVHARASSTALSLCKAGLWSAASVLCPPKRVSTLGAQPRCDPLVAAYPTSDHKHVMVCDSNGSVVRLVEAVGATKAVAAVVKGWATIMTHADVVAAAVGAGGAGGGGEIVEGQDKLLAAEQEVRRGDAGRAVVEAVESAIVRMEYEEVAKRLKKHDVQHNAMAVLRDVAGVTTSSPEYREAKCVVDVDFDTQGLTLLGSPIVPAEGAPPVPRWRAQSKGGHRPAVVLAGRGGGDAGWGGRGATSAATLQPGGAVWKGHSAAGKSTAGGDGTAEVGTLSSGKVMSGVTVLELADNGVEVATAAATAMMQRLGAKVVKVEVGRADPLRASEPSVWRQLNAGKASVSVPLSARGKAQLKTLVAGVDVVVCGLPLDEAAILGVDATTVEKVNTRAAYVRLTPRGPDGSGARRSDGASRHWFGVWWGRSSMAALLAGAPPGTPPPPPSHMGDLVVSPFVAAAAATALLHAARTGKGRVVDVAMLSVGMWTGGVIWVMVNCIPGAVESVQHRAEVMWKCFPVVTFNGHPTRDGRFIQLLGLNVPRFFKPLSKAVGVYPGILFKAAGCVFGDVLPGLVTRPHLKLAQRVQPLIGKLNDTFRAEFLKMTYEEAHAKLEKHKVWHCEHFPPARAVEIDHFRDVRGVVRCKDMPSATSPSMRDAAFHGSADGEECMIGCPLWFEGYDKDGVGAMEGERYGASNSLLGAE